MVFHYQLQKYNFCRNNEPLFQYPAVVSVTTDIWSFFHLPKFVLFHYQPTLIISLFF